MRQKKHINTKKVVGLLLVEVVVSTLKNTHCGKGCGWLASRGEVVSTKKNTHIVAKDVVGLPVGDSKNNREFD